jgi:hypothetical protein
MTKQLTQAQIKQLRVFLADYGLEVKPQRPKTAKGRRACQMPNGNIIYTTWYRNPTLAEISKPYPKSMTLT